MTSCIVNSMRKVSVLILLPIFFLFSCSSDEPDIKSLIVGGWQLERIRVEGSDCKAIFGSDVPAFYLADDTGCASPTEILGNARRCMNIELNENGQGFFLWSAIHEGVDDAPITYTVENGEMEFCAEQFVCNGPFILVGDNLESATLPLRFDQDCNTVYVLRPK